MKIRFLNNEKWAEVPSATIIRQADDILDILGNSYELHSGGIILHESNLEPDLFDLKNRRLGELIQKCVTYSQKLLLIGDWDRYPSTSLQDFIRESNRMGFIRFQNELKRK